MVGGTSNRSTVDIGGGAGNRNTDIPESRETLWRKKDFIVGAILALIIWGAQLIGVTVNLWLGGLVLLLAFLLMTRAFWIWEGPSEWHVVWRSLTIVVAACLYVAIIMPQIKSEWMKEHPNIRFVAQQQEVKPQDNKPSEAKSEGKKHVQKRAKKTNPGVEQNSRGNDNQQVGYVSQGPCSNLQIGGTNNQQTANCAPVNPNAPVVTYDFQGVKRTSSPGKMEVDDSATLVFKSFGEKANVADWSGY
jgi:hypothetical protein